MQEMVTISIVTYNSRYIFNVLDQLKAELGTDSIYDIHIYDNHSETAYLEKLTTYEPFITIHRAEEIKGLVMVIIKCYSMLRQSMQLFLIPMFWLLKTCLIVY